VIPHPFDTSTVQSLLTASFIISPNSSLPGSSQVTSFLGGIEQWAVYACLLGLIAGGGIRRESTPSRRRIRSLAGRRDAADRLRPAGARYRERLRSAVGRNSGAGSAVTDEFRRNRRRRSAWRWKLRGPRGRSARHPHRVPVEQLLHRGRLARRFETPPEVVQHERHSILQTAPESRQFSGRVYT
jgi:hypothetical protein